MENIKNILIVLIGAPLFFGFISWVVNKIEDLLMSDQPTIVGRPTGKVMQISENEELVEYEKEGHPGETVVRRRGRG